MKGRNREILPNVTLFLISSGLKNLHFFVGLVAGQNISSAAANISGICNIT
jgi:hypothetical protein